MKNNKEYRFKDNPKEQEFFDKFKEWCLNETEGINDNILDKVIFGTTDNSQMTPNDFLTERETMICCNLIQWLGSPVGQWFLSECGFVKKEEL